MLSYRHAFHAGNHADVLKHLVLIEMLAYMNQKDKPWWYVDTHAGAGIYDLSGDYARKNAEYEGGIGRLWGRADLPPALERLVDQVRRLNPDGQLRYYPGSPRLALEYVLKFNIKNVKSKIAFPRFLWRTIFNRQKKNIRNN